MNIKDIVARKSELIALKKMQIKHGKTINSISSAPLGQKSEGGELQIEAIGNLPLLMDSDKDVIMPNAFNKSMQENKNIKFLKDHNHNLSGVVGKMDKVYMKQVVASDLMKELPSVEVQALAFSATPIKAYCEKTYEMYKMQQINQHSIGYQYVKIDLAVNDQNFEEEYKVWQSTIEQILNVAEAEKSGYFWKVSEVKLYEVSAVLWGANSATPVINTTLPNDSEPQKSTQGSKKTMFNFLIPD